jgi:hypothetical protein
MVIQPMQRQVAHGSEKLEYDVCAWFGGELIPRGLRNKREEQVWRTPLLHLWSLRRARWR